jgi:hypothetical protein
MAKQDWKTPFLRLTDQLRPLYDANKMIYHGVVMAPSHKDASPDAFEEIIGGIAAADEGYVLSHSIRTPGA